jgi:superfamily II DNA/RNA helicase
MVKFRAVGANTGPGGSGLTKVKELLSTSPVDILVATTGRLLQLLDSRAIDLRFTRHIIVDEVDTMFDVGFGPELRKILSAARGRGDVVNKAQYIAVGATHPTAAEEMYAVEFPAAKRIDVDLHVTPPGLEARFIRTTAEGKVPELVALLGECKSDGHLRGGRVIIFCNTISSARFVDHFLSESGYTTSCIHGEIPFDRRNAEFSGFKAGDTQLLVCTDIAARGLDNLEIAHVILFDFPTSAVDYIHRAGRTARAGATGRVTSLVLKRDLALARAVERSSQERNDTLVSARLAREEERQRKLREENDRRDRERAARDSDAEDAQRFSNTATTQSRSFKEGDGSRGGRANGSQSDRRVSVTRTRGRGRSSRGAFSSGRGRGKTYGTESGSRGTEGGGGRGGSGTRSPGSSRGRGAYSRGPSLELGESEGMRVGSGGSRFGDEEGRTFRAGSKAGRGRGQTRGTNFGRRGQSGSSRGSSSSGRRGGTR